MWNTQFHTYCYHFFRQALQSYLAFDFTVKISLDAHLSTLVQIKSKSVPYIYYHNLHRNPIFTVAIFFPSTFLSFLLHLLKRKQQGQSSINWSKERQHRRQAVCECELWRWGVEIELITSRSQESWCMYNPKKKSKLPSYKASNRTDQLVQWLELTVHVQKWCHIKLKFAFADPFSKLKVIAGFKGSILLFLLYLYLFLALLEEDDQMRMLLHEWFLLTVVLFGGAECRQEI